MSLLKFVITFLFKATKNVCRHFFANLINLLRNLLQIMKTTYKVFDWFLLKLKLIITINILKSKKKSTKNISTIFFIEKNNNKKKLLKISQSRWKMNPTDQMIMMRKWFNLEEKKTRVVDEKFFVRKKSFMPYLFTHYLRQLNLNIKMRREEMFLLV